MHKHQDTKTAALLICALANHCEADATETAQMLIGYLFDEEDFGDVKRQIESLERGPSE